MRMARTLRLAMGLGFALAFATFGANGAPRSTPTKPPLLAAFYVPWETPALASFKAHVNDIDVFAPFWGSLVSPAGKIVWEDDPEAHLALAQASRRPLVLPMLSNAHDDIWDTAAAQGVILKPAAAATFARNLVQHARGDHLAGVVLDFENLTPASAAAYPAFLRSLRAKLNAAGLELWVTSTLTAEDGMPPDLDRDADAVVLMAYDQCWATSTPGPIASDAWIAANLEARLAGHDPSRFIVALAGYGYDWPMGGKAKVISAADAERLAERDDATITPLPNPHFEYRSASGSPHEVWYLDGAAFARQRALAEAAGVRGVALWRMGLEDGATWTARAQAPNPPTGPTANCEPLPGR